MNKILATTALLCALGSQTAIANSMFYGSLYMLDNNGNAVNNPQCPECNAAIGEIDNNLTSLVDLNAGTATDIIGNHDFVDTGLNWSISNMNWWINPDNTISASGIFNWTNYNGLTQSTFSQLSDPLGGNGEIIARDSAVDADPFKGNALIDGPFVGYTIYLEGQIAPIPVPATFWLFASGAAALFGFTKRRKIS